MSSRVLLRRSSDVLRKSWLKGAVGTPQGTALDAGGPMMLLRSQFDPALELNYIDDPRLAVGETFARATVRTVRDFEGRTLTCKSGEVGFWGFRRIENLIATKSEDITDAAWTKTGSTASAATRLREDASNGEHRVTQVLANAAGALAGQFEAIRAPGSSRNVQIDITNAGNSLTLKVDLSTGAVISSAAAGTVSLVQAEAERRGSRWRLKIAGTGFAAASTFAARMLDANGNVAYQGDGSSEIDITRFQATAQNGQSFIGAPEYISVGVLPAPYHGAGVDGVRYFATDYANVLIKRFDGDTLKYLQVSNGAAGFATTPTSAALNPAGAASFVFRMIAPPGNVAVANKSANINLNGWRVRVTSAFKLVLEWGDGAAGLVVQSTVAVPYASGTPFWGRIDFEPNPGGGSRVARFYTSAKEAMPFLAEWIQLGTTMIGAATQIATNATRLLIGSCADSGNQANAPIVFRFQLYSGVVGRGGVVVADFNPNDAAAAGSANFVSAATGETYTIADNGTTARINTFTKPGRRGLRVEVPTANLQIRSDDLADATYTKTRATATSNVIAGLDGTAIGDKLVEDATAGATHIVQDTSQAKAASALAYTMTAYLRAGERSAARLDVFNGVNGAFARFNLLDGTVLTAATAFGAGWVAGTASIAQVSPGVYACVLPVTSDATAAIQTQIGLYNAADAYNGDNASGAYVLAQQLEQLDHATSYLPTAAATVARNLDSPSLALGTWFNAAAGAVLAAFYRESYVGAAQNIASLSDNTANERMDLFGNAGTAARLVVVDGGVSQVDVNGGVFGVSAKGAAGFAYALNDFSLDSDSATIATDNAGTLPTVTQLDIGHARGAAALDGWIARLWVHDKRLADSRIPAQLTTMVAA